VNFPQQRCGGQIEHSEQHPRAAKKPPILLQGFTRRTVTVNEAMQQALHPLKKT
jgi:hypothetical protein